MKKLLLSCVALLCAYSVSFAVATATKVTDKSTLVAGDKIAIVNMGDTIAMSTTQNTGTFYRGIAAFDVANVTTAVEQVELVASGSNFKLKVTGGYLYYDATWTKNWLGTSTTGTDFTFEDKDGNLLLKEVASGRYILFNGDRFACYGSTSSVAKGATHIFKVEGTADAPVVEEKSVAEALTIIDGLGSAASADEYIVEGIVSEILTDDAGIAQYKNCDFWITDLNDASKKIKAFRTKGIDGAEFTAGLIAVGDTVKVKGVLKKYNSTPEIDKGSLVEVRKGEGVTPPVGGDTLTVNYAQAIYWAEYSAAGAENWEIDFINDISEEDYDVRMYIYLYTPTKTKIAGNWSAEAGTINPMYSGLEIVNAPGDTTFLSATDVTLSIEYVGSDAEGYLEYNVNASMTCDDGKTYNVAQVLAIGAYDGDTYQEIVLQDDASGIEQVAISNPIFAVDGRIYAEEGARIYSLTGLDVTASNGALSDGIYVVKTAKRAVKIAVKR